MRCTWLLFPCYFLLFFCLWGQGGGAYVRAVFLPFCTLVCLVDLSVKSFVYVLDYFVLLNKFDFISFDKCQRDAEKYHLFMIYVVFDPWLLKQ